ncbi:hypothetical protein WA026_018475, partial [Henosepilachna vigintioctopunctata]
MTYMCMNTTPLRKLLLQWFSEDEAPHDLESEDKSQPDITLMLSQNINFSSSEIDLKKGFWDYFKHVPLLLPKSSSC